LRLPRENVNQQLKQHEPTTFRGPTPSAARGVETMLLIGHKLLTQKQQPPDITSDGWQKNLACIII
jgi:hypothetical protein